MFDQVVESFLQKKTQKVYKCSDPSVRSYKDVVTTRFRFGMKIETFSLNSLRYT